MRNSPYVEIQEQLARFLSGDLEREDFRRWLAPILWNAEYFDPSVESLVYNIEIAFAELDAGQWSPAEFSEELRALIQSDSSQQDNPYRQVGSLELRAEELYIHSGRFKFKAWVIRENRRPQWKSELREMEPSSSIALRR